MNFLFWNMIPGDSFFSELNKLPKGRQKRFFTMIGEECLEYNRTYDTAYTFSEFKASHYPGGLVTSQTSEEDEADDEELGYQKAEPE